ncbi:MAG TPA: ROK family protein [Methylomirabilota bacterium]|nr:ROK family protein [Methylomirabilota bacterium]
MAEPNQKAEHVIGVDLGGTKILAGIFTPSLKCLAKSKLTTKAERGVKDVIARVARCARDAADEADLSFKDVRAVAIGAPGVIDEEAGRVVYAPNLRWENVPLQKELEAELGVPVFIGNDCQIATRGVYVAEMKSKPRNMVAIFVGTGIGGGLVIDGQLFQGAGSTAGEIGHMVLQPEGPKCSCGNKGCFEALASRRAIFQRIHVAVKEGKETLLTQTVGKDLRDLRSGDLRRAIRKGDKLVQQIVSEAAEHIGIVAANVFHLLNPEVIMLGGGVIEALAEEMMDDIARVAKDHALPHTYREKSILASSLGDNAGITGAAVTALEKSRQRPAP